MGIHITVAFMKAIDKNKFLNFVEVKNAPEMLPLCCSAIQNCSDENVTMPRLPKRGRRPASPCATHKPLTVFSSPRRGTAEQVVP